MKPHCVLSIGHWNSCYFFPASDGVGPRIVSSSKTAGDSVCVMSTYAFQHCHAATVDDRVFDLLHGSNTDQIFLNIKMCVLYT